MTYRCMDCGRKFYEPEICEEYRGECFGFPAYETVSCCPYCHGDYEEIEEEYESEYDCDEC